MELELSDRVIDQIASKVALIVVKKIKESTELNELVTTAEAAAILRITPGRMRQIADRYPHIKMGDCKQGKLLFVRDALFK